MANRKGRLPASRDNEPFLYRASTVANRESIRESDRSVPIVLATENPIPVYDLNRKAVVMERLMLDGMEIPSQVPMADTHDRSSVRNVLGSIRDLKVVGGELQARAYFASDDESKRVFELYRDGHLTDFSVGAPVLEARYDGSNKDVVRSRLIEGSAVVAGMDPHAKTIGAMRAYVDPYGMKEEEMQKAVLDQLVKRGLSPDATDEEALAFLERSLDESSATTVAAETITETTANSDAVAETEETEEMATTADTQAALAAERNRVIAIDDLCRTHKIADDVRRTYLTNPEMTIERASTEILRTLKPVGVPVGDAPISGGTSQREKWYEAARAGVVSRAVSEAGCNPSVFLNRVAAVESGANGRPCQWSDRDAVRRSQQLQKELSEPVHGSEDFRYVTITDIARMMLEQAGERNLIALPKHEIVRRALQMPEFVRRSSDGPAFHTTGSFSNLFLDASNKTLLAAYDEAPATYPMWVRQAPSAADFKQLNRIRFGELADPEDIPENGEYPEKSTSDAKESYSVTKKGQLFSISFEALANDDMNAITRIPAMQGFAMRRKINKDVYAILTGNPNLSDGIAIFHATSHGANLDATALDEAALDVGFTVMSTQRGLSSDSTALGIAPAFLIVPYALGAVAHRLTSGMVIPTANSGVPLYGAGRVRPLTVVEEPQLDLDSTTGWYLSASSNQIETVELTFLQGEEAPVLERENGFTTDTVKYKIRQTYAPKAIDYRGLYQGNV